MKKLFCLLLCLILPVCALAEAPAKLSENDFVLTLNEKEFRLGDEVTPLLETMETLFEALPDMTMAPSCMFDGFDREYANDALVVGTYPINGEDRIETIMVVTDTIETARGAYVGCTKADVESVYGTDYTFDYDQMIYAMGDPVTEPILVFCIDPETETVTLYYYQKNTTK